MAESELVLPFDLPPADATEEMVAEWIHQALVVLDDRPRIPTWRHRALGQDRATVIAEGTSRSARIEINLPVGEWRVVKAAAEGRDLPLRTYVRRALANTMIICDGLTAEDIPRLAAGGLIRP